MSGPIPGALGSLANLEVLRLRDNQLSGPIPGALGSLAELRLLYLNDNELTGPIPGWLGSLAKLEYLTLSDTLLTGPFPSSLTALSLEELWLDVCVPPLHQAWVQTIAHFRGTVCGALPHIPGIRPPR